MQRLVIYGSRSLSLSTHTIEKAVMERWGVLPSAVIGGKARGPDTAGERWAKLRGIPFLPFPADWDRYGKSAGAIRNRQMASACDWALGFWDGVSRGTSDMTAALLARGIEPLVIVRSPWDTHI